MTSLLPTAPLQGAPIVLALELTGDETEGMPGNQGSLDQRPQVYMLLRLFWFGKALPPHRRRQCLQVMGVPSVPVEQPIIAVKFAFKSGSTACGLGGPSDPEQKGCCIFRKPIIPCPLQDAAWQRATTGIDALPCHPNLPQLLDA